MSRKVEVFTAGCPLCDETVKMVQDLACEYCEVSVYNLQSKTPEYLAKANDYGINSVPTVVVNGKVLDCCKRGKITREDLEVAGIGQPLE
ncbi:MAG: glutaredoxin [Desulfobacteraceae bacterium]|nr:glutaredoxin [Desulfobacteraceae bacterium]